MLWRHMRSTLVRTVPPTVEPVTVSDLKMHGRIGLDVSAEDPLIQNDIKTAVEWLERDTASAFCQQTMRLRCDCFPCDVIEIWKHPVQSITSIQYVQEDGTTATWASSNYIVNTDSKPARITLAYDKTWPTARAVENAVTVTFVAGYATVALIPEHVKQAIRILAWDMVQNREADGDPDTMHKRYQAFMQQVNWQAYR